MTDDDIVTYAINGLSEKYANLATIIAHKDPFPDLETMRSMVTTEEMRLNSKSSSLSTNTTSSASHVLLTETNNSRGQDSRNNRDSRNNTRNFEQHVCRNFGRGFCRWGNNCRFIHDSSRGSNLNATASNTNPRNTGTQTSNPNSFFQNLVSSGLGTGGMNLGGQQQLLALLQAQNSLLAQYGLSPLMGQAQSHATFTQFGLLGSTHGSAQQSMLPGQETVLPQAFNTTTLQDPTNATWNMDTGATSHLNSSAKNLST
ncbi:hybrid signal transduction histidine kinase M [Tanacetum coccineum]